MCRVSEWDLEYAGPVSGQTQSHFFQEQLSNGQPYCSHAASTGLHSSCWWLDLIPALQGGSLEDSLVPGCGPSCVGLRSGLMACGMHFAGAWGWVVVVGVPVDR